MSTQPCGCDEEAAWVCKQHQEAGNWKLATRLDEGDVFVPSVQIFDKTTLVETTLTTTPPLTPNVTVLGGNVPGIDTHLPKRPTQGDPRFHALLEQIGALHDQKQADYGTGADPFANVRASADWGIAPWIGALVRATDKVKRLQKFAREGHLANESVEDSFMDLAVYSLIGLILFKETQS